MPRAKKSATGATTTELVVKPPRKRPGPKPKPLSERVYKPAKPIQRIENSYSQRRKEEVLLYLLNHTIYDPDSWKSVNCYRKPFQRDAAKHFKIPEATIHTWWKNRTSILNREKKSRKKRGSKGKYLVLPTKLDMADLLIKTNPSQEREKQHRQIQTQQSLKPQKHQKRQHQNKQIKSHQLRTQNQQAQTQSQ